MALLIFDLDGTLVDSARMILAAHRRGFAALGLPRPPDEALLGAVGLSLPETFRHLCGEDAPIDALAAAYKHAWRALLDEGHAPPLYPGADDLVRGLHRDGHVLSIATGKTRKGVEDLLAQQDWEGLFASLHCADTARSKPDPDMIEQALRLHDCPAGECVMIGDTGFDMAMARAAGVRSIGVSWGFHERAALAEAGRIVDDFAALKAAIKEL